MSISAKQMGDLLEKSGQPRISCGLSAKQFRAGILVENSGNETPIIAKRSKYNAVRSVDCLGRTWDSNAERRRYSLLCAWESTGQIKNLERQPVFEMFTTNADGKRKSVGKYKADFRYVKTVNGAVIIEDVKSKPTRTPVYRLKKKIVEWQYGITITEVQ